MNLFKEKVNLQNECKHKFVSLFYQLSSFYNLKCLRNEALDYIYRWFTIIATTENFQQLDFNNVNKILSSSELNISSELEVFNASDFWLSCESFDRCKFAKELFLKTRFPLLSDHVTRSLLERKNNSNDNTFFHKVKNCLVLIEEILKNKEEFYKNKSTIYYKNRYCNSSMYDILLCSRFDKSCKININYHNFEADSFKEVKKYTTTMKWAFYKAVFVKNRVYLLYYDENNEKLGFIRHSPFLKTWENLNSFYDRALYGHRMCSFVDNIYFMGGIFNNEIGKSCVLFDTNTEKWNEVAKMNDYRINAASTVFEGRVVVSGGLYEYRYLHTVEAYDHVEGKWSYMPSMINESCGHDMLAISNKLFAIGCGENFDIYEVYDTISGKFVILNTFPKLFDGTSISIGRKIMVFKINSSFVVIYDVDKNEWYGESFEVTKNTCDFHCLKIPSLKL